MLLVDQNMKKTSIKSIHISLILNQLPWDNFMVNLVKQQENGKMVLLLILLEKLAEIDLKIDTGFYLMALLMLFGQKV